MRTQEEIINRYNERKLCDPLGFEAYVASGATMSNWMDLVCVYAPDHYKEYQDLYREHTLIVCRMNKILIDAATNAQLRFAPKIRYFEFAYMDDVLIGSNFSDDGKIDYNTFTLDASKLYSIVRQHIIEYMNDGIIPRPNTMVIGKELQECVVHGFLPKRFRLHIMDFDIRYDSSISGVMFLE